MALVGLMAKRQSDKRLVYEEEQLKQLRLDAAMRAGQLFYPGSTGHAEPAAMASGLLALTRLDHADLAVVLLVDLWSVNGQSALQDGAPPPKSTTVAKGPITSIPRPPSSSSMSPCGQANPTRNLSQQNSCAVMQGACWLRAEESMTETVATTCRPGAEYHPSMLSAWGERDEIQ
jgi:hypothetical protein